MSKYIYRYVTVFLLFVISASSFCQENIHEVVLKNGKTIECRIDKVGQDSAFVTIFKENMTIKTYVMLSDVAYFKNYCVTSVTPIKDQFDLAFEDIKSFNEKSKSELQTIAKNWIAETFVSQESVISGEGDGLISGQFLFDSYAYAYVLFYGMKPVEAKIKVNFVLRFKDGKVKFLMNNIKYRLKLPGLDKYDSEKPYELCLYDENGGKKEGAFESVVPCIGSQFEFFFSSLCKYIDKEANSSW
mgnify:CR=1 FL=1